MGTWYTAWLGTPTERLKEVDFFKHYELNEWISEFVPSDGHYQRCVHPGCKQTHRIFGGGIYIYDRPTLIDHTGLEFIEWVLKGELPLRIEDNQFQKALEGLDVETDYDRPVRECLELIIGLDAEKKTLQQQLRELKADYYYPEWPDERIALVRDLQVWIEGA